MMSRTVFAGVRAVGAVLPISAQDSLPTLPQAYQVGG
jgi:hypothetical protein